MLEGVIGNHWKTIVVSRDHFLASIWPSGWIPPPYTLSENQVMVEKNFINKTRTRMCVKANACPTFAPHLIVAFLIEWHVFVVLDGFLQVDRSRDLRFSPDHGNLVKAMISWNHTASVRVKFPPCLMVKIIRIKKNTGHVFMFCYFWKHHSHLIHSLNATCYSSDFHKKKHGHFAIDELQALSWKLSRLLQVREIRVLATGEGHDDDDDDDDDDDGDDDDDDERIIIPITIIITTIIYYYHYYYHCDYFLVVKLWWRWRPKSTPFNTRISPKGPSAFQRCSPSFGAGKKRKQKKPNQHNDVAYLRTNYPHVHTLVRTSTQVQIPKLDSITGLGW